MLHTLQDKLEVSLAKLRTIFEIALFLGSLAPLGAFSMSWQDAALQEAGIALPEEGLWGNPAAIPAERRMVFEGGLGGTTDTLKPWFTSSLPMGEKSALAVGGYWGPYVEMRAATQLLSGTWIGLQGSWNDHAEQPLNAGLGIWQNLNEHWHLGWVGRNLVDSLDREFGMGVDWSLVHGHLDFVFDAFTPAFTSHDLEQAEYSLGLRASYGEMHNVQIAGSVRLGDAFAEKPILHAGAGIALQQYFFHTLVGVRYALEEFPLLGEGEMRHHVTLGIVWDAFVDHENPEPKVRATYALLSNADTTLPQELDFITDAGESSGKVHDWSLVVYTATNDLTPARLVRRFTAEGLPPRSLHWRIDDLGGNPCPPGMYAYRLIVTDAAGNQGWTTWQNFEIR